MEVRHCLLTDNRIGLRFGDSYAWEDLGSMTVSHTVSVANHDANVLNLTDTGNPKPDAIQISCSMVDEAAHDGQDGTLQGIPSWTTHDGCLLEPTTCQDLFIGPTSCDYPTLTTP